MTRRTRTDIEMLESQRLAAYACQAGRSRGRRHPESEDPVRTAFARDRDRVVHSSAFRRLEYKTQVLLNTAGDHFRTRLTHTLEVANLSRGIARALGLNEDLCEAQALAHDLGHPPFGHSGETALNEIMAAHGGFEHNRQGLRVVDELERRYPGRPGMNLTYEVRETFVKNFPPPVREKLGFRADEQINLEAQVCSFADAFAYECHDIDDGLSCGLLQMGALSQLELVQAARLKAEDEFPELKNVTDAEPATEEARLRRQYLQKRLVRNLLDFVVNDAIGATADRLSAAAVDSPDTARRQAQFAVACSPGVQAQRKALRAYLYAQFYMHPTLQAIFKQANGWLKTLFAAFSQAPQKLPDWYRERFEKLKAAGGADADGATARVICDYIAGCTDRYVFSEYTRVVGKKPDFSAGGGLSRLIL